MTKAPKDAEKTKALYALLWLPDLSKGAACLAAWLVWHANTKTGQCNPGQARLINETGLSERKIRDAKRELEARRIISSRQVDRESTEFTINWHALSKLTDQYEAIAMARGVVVQPRAVRGPKKTHAATSWGQKTAVTGAENCREEGQKTAPKLFEGNSLKEPVYSVGPVSEGAETGNYGFSTSEQDGLGMKMLETEENFNFVKLFQRVIVEEGKRLPRTDVSEMISARLEQASEGCEGAEGSDYRSQSRRYFENFDDFLEPEHMEAKKSNG